MILLSEIKKSVTLITPTGLPAASITGAAWKPRRVKNSKASGMEASARREIGGCAIKSEAVRSERHSRARFSAKTLILMINTP